jgi:beta-galactosidase
VDKKGNIVPLADNLVQFAIEGNGRIIGLDNGNPFDHDSYKLMRRKAFNGLGLVIVQSTMKPGTIKITATSDGLKADSVAIETKPSKTMPFIP